MIALKSTRLIVSGTALAALLGFGLLPSLPVNAQNPAPPVSRPGQKMGREKHPEIRRAMANLQRAESFLKHADHDFAGHREKALDLTQQALKECRAALAADRK